MMQRVLIRRVVKRRRATYKTAIRTTIISSHQGINFSHRHCKTKQHALRSEPTWRMKTTIWVPLNSLKISSAKKKPHQPHNVRSKKGYRSSNMETCGRRRLTAEAT